MHKIYAQNYNYYNINARNTLFNESNRSVRRTHMGNLHTRIQGEHEHFFFCYILLLILVKIKRELNLMKPMHVHCTFIFHTKINKLSHYNP